MTKNHRRKQAARRRAQETGASYTSALRRVTTLPGSAGGPSPAGTDVAVLSLDQLHQFQRLLEARVWELVDPEPSDLDEQGFVTNFNVLWRYPEAYGGQSFVEDVEPTEPQCRVDYDEAGEESDRIVIQTAGNWQGCEDHGTKEIAILPIEADMARLPNLLSQVEAEARTMDPTELLECAANGPCATNIVRRAAESQRRLDWLQAMANAAKRMTPAERDELRAWEHDNLDGHSVGTSDWPGWVELIGKPPWKQDQQTKEQ